MTAVRIEPDRLARYDVTGPRYTSYPAVPAWQAPFGAEAYRDALEDLAGLARDPVSVYVHLPYCGYRCHYCACTVAIASERSNRRFRVAITTETAIIAALVILTVC